MSCYKSLLSENMALRLKLLELQLKIRGRRSQFAHREWISTDELNFVLDSMPFKSPWRR